MPGMEQSLSLAPFFLEAESSAPIRFKQITLTAGHELLARPAPSSVSVVCFCRDDPACFRNQPESYFFQVCFFCPPWSPLPVFLKKLLVTPFWTLKLTTTRSLCK